MDCFPTDLNSWPPLRLPREFLALQGRVEPVSGTAHFFPRNHCPPNGWATTSWVDWTSEQGCGTKRGMESSFLPFQFGCWCMPHACRGREGNWQTLPPFISSLVCFCRQDKEGMGVSGLLILIQFLATKSYKNIQRYFTHYQFATVFPSSYCHCPPFPRSSPEMFEKTMYGYMMTFVSYLQSVFPKEGVFSYSQVRQKHYTISLCLPVTLKASLTSSFSPVQDYLLHLVIRPLYLLSFVTVLLCLLWLLTF